MNILFIAWAVYMSAVAGGFVFCLLGVIFNSIPDAPADGEFTEGWTR